MRILWIVNIVMPDLAKRLGVKGAFSGTWMIDLANQISSAEDIELGVACVFGKEYRKVAVGNITYYTIPGNGRTMMFFKPSLAKYWKEIEKDFHPDIVHIHGTEYTHSISYLRNYPDKKYLLTIQGVVKKVSENHDGGLSVGELLRYRTFYENTHFSGMIEKTLVSKKNSRYEKEIIQSVKYATGRTDWDRFYIESVNPDIDYRQFNYNLREEFYSASKWTVDESDRYEIFVSTAAQMPLKGGHIVLKSIDIVRKRIPNVRFTFLAKKALNGEIIVVDGYSKLIKEKVSSLGIANNVRFLEPQNTEGMISLLRHSRMCIVPSAVENASATMREAMHLGTPVIAAFRGGMINLIEDGKSGFYYDYPEYEYLAGRIIQLIENDALAQSFSIAEIEIAEQMHNRDKNTSLYLNLYREINLS